MRCDGVQCCSAFLVGLDLGVRQAEVVIDEGMDVVVCRASGGSWWPARRRASRRRPDPAELLHIHVDQRQAGRVSYRTSLALGPDQLARDRVQHALWHW